MEANLEIVDMDGMIVPLSLNIAQRMLHKTIEEVQLANGYPVRIIILKARRQGMSTYTEGRFFKEINHRAHVNAVVASADIVSTNKVFKMAKMFQKNMPNEIQRETDYSNRKEIVYSDPHGSAFIAQTAGTDVLGRGGQNHYFHCLRYDTKVVLDGGVTKEIQDIEIGDVVMTSSGSPSMVINKVNTGVKKTRRIRTWMSNEPVHLTPDHEVLTPDGYKRCDGLTTMDYIATPMPCFTGIVSKIQYELPNKPRLQGGGANHKETDVIKLDYDFGYYLGYYLAEGHVSKQWKSDRYSGIVFAYHKKEKYIEKAMKFASQHCKSAKERLFPDSNRATMSVYGTFLASLTESICGRVNNKHLPDFLFDSNDKFGRGILDGYIDGDGSKTAKDKITIVTVHERSARQLKRLIVSLGLGVPSMVLQSNLHRYDKKVKDAFRITLSGDVRRLYLGERIGKWHSHNKFKFHGSKCYVRVKSIECDPVESPVYDITVDSDDHDFDTTIGIVKNCTEFAFWKDAKTQFGGAMQEVPDKDSMVVIESTACGIGGAFHDMYWEAKEDWKFSKSPGNFLPIFFPWYIFPDYKRKIPLDMTFLVGRPHASNIPAEWLGIEQEMVRKFGLSNEQLYWRRWAIKNKCQNDLNLYDQEYPWCDSIAFNATGRNVFLHSKIETMECSDGRTALLIKQGDRIQPESVDMQRNCWQIWKTPHAAHSYAIGIDTMEGTQSDPDDPKSNYDYHAMSIFDRDTGEIVAVYLGRGSQSDIGHQAVLAAKWYNSAWVAPELPMGMVVLDVLKESGYDRIYQRQKADEQRIESDSMNLGWRTTILTRPKMVDNFKTAFNEGDIKIYSQDLIDEMKTFVYDKQGTPRHRPGKHDDLLFASMIALQLHLRLPHHSQPFPCASTDGEPDYEPTENRSLSMRGAVDLWDGDEDDDNEFAVYTE